MLNNARQAEMKEYIKNKKNVAIQQLIDQFQVSDMTIRRDLIHLDKAGYIRRVHGGALYLQPVEEAFFSERELVQRQEKERIAEKAASLIEDGDIILLDGGTTTHAIAQKITNRKNITVITNAVNIASLLSQYTNIGIVMPGGDILHTTGSLVGPATVKFLQNLRVDKAFIGCGGIALDRGLLNANMTEGEVKQVMMQISGKTYVVADHSKFGQTSFYVFASLQKADAIITNQELSESVKSEFQQYTDLPKLIFA